MNIRPSSDLRNNYNEIAKIAKSSGPVFLTLNGKGDTVIMSIEDYNQREDMYLRQRLGEAADDIAAGRVRPFNDAITALENKAIERLEKEQANNV